MQNVTIECIEYKVKESTRNGKCEFLRSIMLGKTVLVPAEEVHRYGVRARAMKDKKKFKMGKLKNGQGYITRIS